MKKILALIIILITINIYGQSSGNIANAINNPISVSNPPVLIGANSKTTSPAGEWKVYTKDDIRWETYNINGFNTAITTITSSLYKPLTYTPSSLEITTALGYIPYNSSNPNGYISSYIETDPIWTGVSVNYRTKVQNDLLYQPIGSYLTTEADPTVPSYSKTLTTFSVIKSSTDILYEPVFTKNTGFNKNFGSTSNTVVEGNDLRVVNAVPNTRTINSIPLTSNITLIKGDIGLGNVDNTSDLNKPISTTTQTALNGKQDLLVSGTNIKTIGGSSILGSGNISLNSGTVTSIGIIGSDFSISGSPVTTSGNISLSLSNTGIPAGTYGKLTVDAKGRATAGKRQETYSGVTDASGNYTVTFGTPYSVAPNIQVCLINPNLRDTPVPTVSTTGFTINVQRRVDVIGLLPTYSNVVGGAVDVLITEK